MNEISGLDMRVTIVAFYDRTQVKKCRWPLQAGRAAPMPSFGIEDPMNPVDVPGLVADIRTRKFSSEVHGATSGNCPAFLVVLRIAGNWSGRSYGAPPVRRGNEIARVNDDFVQTSAPHRMVNALALAADGYGSDNFALL